ncbi:MAG: hypothetical protein ACLFPE_09385 [Bacteroidales bacterium]
MLQVTFDKIVYRQFPMAMNSRDTSIHFLGLLKQKHHLDISRMLMATSFCADELNNENTSFFGVVNGPFMMGGLAGMPFTGVTGMKAFAHHIPEGGSAMIFYGAHIGITHEGELGKAWRPGQQSAGASCGALMNALGHLSDDSYRPGDGEDDHQMYFIEKKLLPHREEIIRAENPKLRITEITFELIDRQIHEYLEKARAEFNIKKLALLGGIIINTGYGIDDYFVPKNFEVLLMK